MSPEIGPHESPTTPFPDPGAREASSTMFVSHVGDSRAYLFRDGKLKQLTGDHTHVQELVDTGTITREEAATHRLRHVLTNAIGGRHRSIDVDVQRVRLQDADRLLFVPIAHRKYLDRSVCDRVPF